MEQWKNQQNPDIEKMMLGFGALAEIVHNFYTAMIKSGASPQEAQAGTNAFIAAFVHESMAQAREKNREGGQGQ